MGPDFYGSVVWVNVAVRFIALGLMLPSALCHCHSWPYVICVNVAFGFNPNPPDPLPLLLPADLFAIPFSTV